MPIPTRAPGLPATPARCRRRAISWTVRVRRGRPKESGGRQRGDVGCRPDRTQSRHPGLTDHPATGDAQSGRLRRTDGAPPQRRRDRRNRAGGPTRTRPRRAGPPRRRTVRARHDQVVGQPGLAAPRRRPARGRRTQPLLPDPGRAPGAGLPARHAPPGHHRHRRLHQRHRVAAQAGRHCASATTPTGSAPASRPRSPRCTPSWTHSTAPRGTGGPTST